MTRRRGALGNKTQKSKSVIIYFPIAALLIIFLTIFGTSVFLRIIQIEVLGVNLYTEEDVIYYSGITPGSNLLTIDRSRAARRIEEALPYVSYVRIVHMLPDTVRIYVTESTAVAWVRFQGNALIIDSSGRILDQSREMPDHLIDVRGVIPADTTIRSFIAYESQLALLSHILVAMETAGIADNVRYLDITDSRNITFRYTERFLVELGGSDDVLHKLNQLPIYVMDNIPGGASGRIDMRNPARVQFVPVR